MNDPQVVIHLDGALPLAVLDERGWVQGSWEDAAGHVCAHQAIRLCDPIPGDAFLIEQVAQRKWGKGVAWNDDSATTEADVREWFAGGIDVTDADLGDVFGPQWRAVVELVRRTATLTEDEAERLSTARNAARNAARSTAWDAAWNAAWNAAWDAARDAAWNAAWDAAWDATWNAAWAAAWNAARDAAWAAAWAVVTWDLATSDGPYTFTHRDLLMAPWVEVCGLPAGLLDTLDLKDAQEA